MVLFGTILRPQIEGAIVAGGILALKALFIIFEASIEFNLNA